LWNTGKFALTFAIFLCFFIFGEFIFEKMACLAGLIVATALKHAFFAIKMVPYGTIITGKWYHMVPFFCYFTPKPEFFASFPQIQPGKNVQTASPLPSPAT